MRATDMEGKREGGRGERTINSFIVYRGESRVIALLLSHQWNFTSDFLDAIDVE
jgi:hypothetical protein